METLDLIIETECWTQKFRNISPFFASTAGTIRADDDSTENRGGPELYVTPPRDINFSSTRGVTLTCLGRGAPRPQISWYTREGRLVHTVSSLMEVLSNGSLVLRPFAADRWVALR